MTVNMFRNKKFNPLVTKLFIRGKKLTISLVFITQFYFAVPKNIRLNSTRYLIMKVSIKRKLQQIGFNYSPVINFEGCMNI